ncbi:unnamed protein product [Amoebophrya sp. A25]|nr:unnamed protein product [Amoebophrya sp. A25]|eukprot:GSA25T00016458001.1
MTACSNAPETPCPVVVGDQTSTSSSKFEPPSRVGEKTLTERAQSQEAESQGQSSTQLENPVNGDGGQSSTPVENPVNGDGGQSPPATVVAEAALAALLASTTRGSVESAQGLPSTTVVESAAAPTTASDPTPPSTTVGESAPAPPQPETVPEPPPPPPTTVSEFKRLLLPFCEELEKKDLRLQDLQDAEKKLATENATLKTTLKRREDAISAAKQACSDIRKRTKDAVERKKELEIAEEEKCASLRRCIEEEIEPMRAKEDEIFEKERQENQELRERLVKFLGEYEARSKILKERDELREAEFTKFEAQIEELKKKVADEAQGLQEVEKRNKGLEKEAAQKRQQIEGRKEDFEECETAVDQMHKDFSTTAEELKILRLRKEILKHQTAEAEARRDRSKDLLKRKKVLARLWKEEAKKGNVTGNLRRNSSD